MKEDISDVNILQTYMFGVRKGLMYFVNSNLANVEDRYRASALYGRTELPGLYNTTWIYHTAVVYTEDHTKQGLNSVFCIE